MTLPYSRRSTLDLIDDRHAANTPDDIDPGLQDAYDTLIRDCAGMDAAAITPDELLYLDDSREYCSPELADTVDEIIGDALVASHTDPIQYPQMIDAATEQIDEVRSTVSQTLHRMYNHYTDNGASSISVEIEQAAQNTIGEHSPLLSHYWPRAVSIVRDSDR